MSRTALFGLAVVLLAGGVLLIAPPLARSFRAKPAVEARAVVTVPDESVTEQKVPPTIMTEYTLTERSGREFRSTELDGTVHVANFFFSACPSECPRQTAEVATLDRDFGPRGVRFVSISCDPERDTPAKLREYADGFNADKQRWVFLTGDFDYIRKLAAEVYLTAVPERMAHRPHLLVVDKWGKLRGSFSWKKPEELASMRELLEQTLAETEPPGADSGEEQASEEQASEEPATKDAKITKEDEE